MPQLSQLHVDQPLTEISILYANANEDFISDLVVPEVPVNKRSDKYFVYSNDHLRVRDSLRRPGSEANEVDYSVSTDAYYCEEYALRDIVLDDEVAIADMPLQVEVDTTELLTYNLMLSEEAATATLLTTNTNLTSYSALSGTSQWDDYINSTPLTNLKTAKTSVRAGILRAANTFIVPYEVGLVLADHPSIKQLVQYTDPNALGTTGLPPVVRGLRVVEAATMQNTANEGQTQSLSSVWGKNAIVAFINPAPRIKSLALAYHFVAPDATTGVRGWAVRKYREDKRRGDMVEVSKLWANKIIAAGAGYLFQTAIS